MLEHSFGSADTAAEGQGHRSRAAPPFRVVSCCGRPRNGQGAEIMTRMLRERRLLRQLRGELCRSNRKHRVGRRRRCPVEMPSRHLQQTRAFSHLLRKPAAPCSHLETMKDSRPLNSECLYACVSCPLGSPLSASWPSPPRRRPARSRRYAGDQTQRVSAAVPYT
jgi:hypothetical protein